MKKAIFLILIVNLVTLSMIDAQISKGSFLIGVSSISRLTGSTNLSSDIFSIGITTIKAEDDEYATDTKMTNINIMPKAGYFILDNIVIGLDGYLFSMSEKYNQNKYSISGIGIGPFARFYFNIGKVVPIVEAGGLMGSMVRKNNYNENESESKNGMSSLWGAAGLSIKLGNRSTFDILAGYNKLTLNYDSDGPEPYKTKLGSTSLKAGFTMLLGSDRANENIHN